MHQNIYTIQAKVKVPDDIARIGADAVDKKGQKGMLETIMRIILHAMVDDPYYRDLPKLCDAIQDYPDDGNKSNIKVTFTSKFWECHVIGRVGKSSTLGRAAIMADCHGMQLSEFLNQCLHCGSAIMDEKSNNKNIEDQGPSGFFV